MTEDREVLIKAVEIALEQYSSASIYKILSELTDSDRHLKSVISHAKDCVKLVRGMDERLADMRGVK